jgi:hypothetical protein
MTTTKGAVSITHHGQPAGGSAQAADALPADDPVSVAVTATPNPTATPAPDAGEDTDERAGLGPGELRPVCDPVSVSMLVEEAFEAGVVDWLADTISEQCEPHDLALHGEEGLLVALGQAARKRVRSRPCGPVTIEVTYDPDTQRITANVAAGTSVATLGAACLAVAFTAADLHPFAELVRGGSTVRRG